MEKEEFRELGEREKIVLSKELRKSLGYDENENLHIQVRQDNEKTIILKIEKCGS